MANNEFEARLTAALERRTEPVVPADFSARVQAALPTAAPVRPARRMGRIVAGVALAVALVAMLVLAPHIRPSFSSIAFDAELLLLAELAAIASWLALKGREV